MTMRRSLPATLFLLAAACSKSEAPPRDQPTPPPLAPATAPAAAPAPAPAAKGVDYGAVDKLIAAARTPEDFEKVYGDCVTLGLQTLTAKNIDLKNVKSDPDYWSHCNLEPARAEAKVILAASKGKKPKPGDANPLCFGAVMHAREIVNSGKPEAKEFEKLVKDLTKPCDL